MLVLNANREQEIFFNELLKITESQVVWDGNFVIMGDRLILEGYVRSLIFHFDIQKAEVDLIDLPDDEDNELEMDAYPGVPDLIALAVYAFESWGLLNGLDIKEDVSELNKRFNNILSAYHFTVTFDKDSIQFYKDGIPVTYEDVIEAAVTSEALPDAWLKLPEFEYYNDQNDTPPVSQAAAASSFAQQSDHDSAASAGRNSQEVAERIEKYHSRIGVLDRLSELQIKSLRRDISWDQLLTDQEKEELLYPVDDYLEQKAGGETGGVTNAPSPADARDEAAVAERIEKYHTRIGVLDRLSSLQKKALRRDITYDRLLTDQEKEELLYPVNDFEYQEKMAVIDEALKDSANRNYAYIRRTMKLVVREDLADNIKTAVTDKLGELAAQYARQEVRAIMEQTPQYVERAGYQELMEQLAPYEEADLAPFQDRLRQMRESLEIKEISNLLAQSQKKTRKDFTDLLRQITEGNYAAESAAPYIENILDWVRDIDKDTLEKLVGNVPAMNFDQALSLYERIDRGSFLPDLKAAALERLSRRLQKIRMEECGKLAYILHKNLANVIKEYAGHHFCPLEKTVRPEELKILDNALSSYAKKRELFEYPIIVVDTSKEGNGQEGMLITPENLFYGTKGNGYKVPVRGIRSIQVSSGLLGHRLVMDTTGGVRYRLPYIVDTEELPAWAGVLGKFVRYLQNTSAPVKPLVRSADDQDVVSCRQCGCVYQKDMERCPECGYTAG